MGGMRPHKRTLACDPSEAGRPWQTSNACGRGETWGHGRRRLKADAEKTSGQRPHRCPARRASAHRADRGEGRAWRMARRVARPAQEREKRNAANGREQPSMPDERQRDPTTTTANSCSRRRDMNTRGGSECASRAPAAAPGEAGGGRRGRRKLQADAQSGMAQTKRGRRAPPHSAARGARGRASSRSGTRSARGHGGRGAPAALKAGAAPGEPGGAKRPPQRAGGKS